MSHINIWPTLLITALLLLAACDGNSRIDAGPGQLSRNVLTLIYTMESGELNSFTRPIAVPGEVALFVSHSEGNQDIGHNPAFARIEVDYGDGEGWVDITQQLYQWDPDKPETLTRHTFTEAGTYFVRARMTYWDGEVVYDDTPGYESGYPITVLPPPQR